MAAGKRGATCTRVSTNLRFLSPLLTFILQDELRTNPKYLVKEKNKLAASGHFIVAGAVAQNNTNEGFGKANRPSTPIKGVISNNFGNQAEVDINQSYEVF